MKNIRLFAKTSSPCIWNTRKVNPFVTNAPFLYPLKISENHKVFSCFQGVEKGCIRNKWLNVNLAMVLMLSVWFNSVSNRPTGVIHLVSKQIFRKTDIAYPLIRTHTCASQRVRNVSFSENFAHVLNWWSPVYNDIFAQYPWKSVIFILLLQSIVTR